jgi:hypothetical protein
MFIALKQCLLFLALSLACRAQSQPVILVQVMDDTLEANGRFQGYLTVIGGGRIVGGSFLGKIPVPQEPEGWFLQLPLYPTGSKLILSGRFYSTDENAPKVPIRCAVSFVSGRDALFFLHFVATSTGYACKLTI